jgi:hypothetical protein
MTSSDQNQSSPSVLSGESDLPFDPGAFQSVHLEIALKNLTSKTTISDGRPGSGKVQLIEFRPKGMILEVPRRSCAPGHSLILDAKVTEPAASRMSFPATAKVHKVEEVSDEVDRLDLGLLQYVEEDWKKLQELFGSRQREIEEFLRAAKGY